MAGKVIHVAIDDRVIALNIEERSKAMEIAYTMRSQLNPITGESFPGKLGRLSILDRDE